MIIRPKDFVPGEAVSIYFLDYRVLVFRGSDVKFLITQGDITREAENYGVDYQVTVEKRNQEPYQGNYECTWQVHSDLNLEVKIVVPLDDWTGKDDFDTSSPIVSISDGPAGLYLQYDAEAGWRERRIGDSA